MNRPRTPAFLAFGAFLFLPFATAPGQLAPQRLYNGINRPLPVTVAYPVSATEPPAAALTGSSSLSSRAEARIDLFEPEAVAPIATAPVMEGGVDLAALFPILWTSPAPKTWYAQLVIGTTKVGAPLVLQPMKTPPTVLLYNDAAKQAWFQDPKSGEGNFSARQGEIVTIAGPPAYSGLRVYIDKHVVFETSVGEIEFRLRPDEAPNTSFNFLHLVEGGFYTDIIFHRVVPKLPSGAPFVIQVGDPTGGGDGGPGYSIDLEPSALAHDFGVLSMARDTDPNTNGSQVFICLSREGTQRLDRFYTAFAQAVRGDAAIKSIASVELVADTTGPRKDRPKDPPILQRAYAIEAPPFGTGPAPLKRDQPATRGER